MMHLGSFGEIIFMPDPVTKLEEDQFAVSLGEPIGVTKAEITVGEKAGSNYSITITLHFPFKQEFVKGGNNDFDPKMGSLAVLKKGKKNDSVIVIPEVNMTSDKNNATFMNLSFKIPDGIKGNHGG